MSNYIVDIYDKNGITISRQITNNQYNIISEINKNDGKISDVLEMGIGDNGEIKGEVVKYFTKKNEYFEELNKQDKEETINAINTCQYFTFDGPTIYVFSDKFSYKINVLNTKNNQIENYLRIHDVFYIRDDEIEKDWNLMVPKEKYKQVNTIPSCSCLMDLFDVNELKECFEYLSKYKSKDEILKNKDKFANSCKKTNDTLDFIKNLSLNEYKISEYDCIHYNTIISSYPIKEGMFKEKIVLYCKDKNLDFVKRNEKDIALFFKYSSN